MASVREVSNITEDLLCPVCLSIFQDPRMLACGHNFCLSCLESCVIPKGQHQGTCPECRGPFDLQDAVHNRVLANLSEKARLLKLEEGCQSGVAGSWHFCEEHEEPLKLFCSQDEAPLCVICRDLPQHQGHNFLPIKNAVKSYQEKLKASLKPLKDGVKWATNNQSRQLETMEELEELREILNEREQNMMESLKQMKEDNHADMERMLEYLKDYESSRHETISSIQAMLEEANDFAFLKEIKTLMRRIQDHLREKNEERGIEAGEDGQGVMEGEESKEEHQDASENNKEEAYGEEAQDVIEYEDGAIIAVSPALGEMEELLNFESWKDMLRSISTELFVVPDPPHYSSSLEEDVLPSEDSHIIEEVEEKETTVTEELDNTVEVKMSTLGMGSLGRQTPLSSGVSSTASTMGTALYRPPLCLPTFPMPLFQPQFFYGNSSMQGGRSWTPCSRWPRGIIPLSRGTSQRQPFCSSWRQGRGNSAASQRSQPSDGNYSHQDSWKSPMRNPSQPGGWGTGWGQGQCSFNKQRPQSSGSNIPGQGGGGFIKNETRKPRQAHVSGQGGDQFNKQRPQSSVGGSSGKSTGQSIKKEPLKPRGGHTPGQGGSRQGRGSAKKGGGAPSGSRGAQNRPQASHREGRGCSRGSGSAKGS